ALFYIQICTHFTNITTVPGIRIVIQITTALYRRTRCCRTAQTAKKPAGPLTPARPFAPIHPTTSRRWSTPLAHHPPPPLLPLAGRASGRRRIPTPPRVAGAPESRALPPPTGPPWDPSRHHVPARGPPDLPDAVATPHRQPTSSSSGSPVGRLLPPPRVVLLPWPPIRRRPSPIAPPNPLSCAAPRLAGTPCICKLLQLAAPPHLLAGFRT
uniref:Uncharacterized protein n=1 Tax=Aegilops tauschii subsp. strangulata TaxID=200361 RepID=A0A453P924_AEGTS